jgi:hypothetical protein
MLNSKLEILNSKQTQMSKTQNSKQAQKPKLKIQKKYFEFLVLSFEFI